MYTSAVASSIYCSLAKHVEKLEILTSFKDFDQLIAPKRRIKTKNYVEMNKSILKSFIMFWSLSVFASLVFLINACTADPELFIYASKIIVLNHVVHIEAFQIFVFVKGIQNRFQFISEEFKRLSKSVKPKSEGLQELQNLLLKLCDINQQFNKCFELPLFFNMMELYSSVLLNVYWLGKAYLGYSYAFVSGKTIRR